MSAPCRDRRLPALAALLALALGCATARPAPAPEAPVLDDLRIEGNRALSDDLIKARILSEGTGWLPFSEKRYFDESIFETDLRRVLRLYQAHGYYRARIVDRKVRPADKGKVDVTIVLEEGPPVRVAGLEVRGLDALAPAEREALLAALPLKDGEIVREAAYDALKVQLAEGLREIGFAEAAVEGAVQVDPDAGTAQVVVEAAPGQRFRFGRVHVAGARRVPRQRIVEEARVAVPEGTLYSESALASAQERVFGIGVFAAVNVSRGAPDREAGIVPVVVSVREAPFRTLRLGLGFGIDQNRQELPRATARWTNNNFLGGLRKLDFENRLALVFLNWNIGGLAEDRGLAGSSTLTFEQPRFLGRRLRFTSSVGYERGFEQTYRFDSTNGRVGFIFANRAFSFVPSYNVAVFNLDANAGVVPRGQEAALDPCARAGELCVLAFLEQRFAYDRRDNPVEATRGYLLSLSLQEGAHWLGSGFTYLRLLPEVRGYLPFGRHVLAGRLQAGLLLPSMGDDSSVLTRFYLGGSGSFRGFGYRQLAPRVVFPLVDEPARFEALPVGGNGLLLANLEARFALPANFGFVLFADAGEVEPEVTGLALGLLHVAAGAGLRYRTLFGPIRLDVGYRLTRVGYATDPFGEGIVGRASPIDPGTPLQNTPGRLSIHFGIGEAF